jgi:ABC-type amino acid transport substrate-binding protein
VVKVSVASGNIPFEDIQCDGYSGWVNDGVKRFTYRLVGDTYNLVQKGRAEALSIGDVVLRRKYFNHKHSADMKIKYCVH